MSSCSSCSARTSNFCYSHKLFCCDHCLVSPSPSPSPSPHRDHELPSHVTCYIHNYFQWLLDPSFPQPLLCATCQQAIVDPSASTGQPLQRLLCKCLFHRACLSTALQQQWRQLTATNCRWSPEHIALLTCPHCSVCVHDVNVHRNSALRKQVWNFLQQYVKAPLHIVDNDADNKENKAEGEIAKSILQSPAEVKTKQIEQQEQELEEKQPLLPEHSIRIVSLSTDSREVDNETMRVVHRAHQPSYSASSSYTSINHSKSIRHKSKVPRNRWCRCRPMQTILVLMALALFSWLALYIAFIQHWLIIPPSRHDRKSEGESI